MQCVGWGVDRGFAKVTDPVQKEEYLNRAVKYLEEGSKFIPNIAGWVLYGNAFLYLEKYNEALICYENAP